MSSSPRICMSSDSTVDPNRHLSQVGLWRGHVRDGVMPMAAWNRLQQHVDDWVNSVAVQTECQRWESGERCSADGKPFRILYKPDRVYDYDDPLLLLTRVVSLQATVTAMIGPAKLFCVDLQHNPAQCDMEDRAWSQNWHRDPEDMQVIKGFFYFSDVGPDNGPFTYVLGSHVAWFHLCSIGSYPAANVIIEDHIPRELVVPVCGPAGTVALCATTGLHRGGTGRLPRTMATLTWVPLQCTKPARFKLRPQQMRQALPPL